MEALALHTGAPTVHWEENTSCIYFVKDKIVTPRVKHIDIPVCFLQEQFDNDNSSVILSDMCTKPCAGPIIIRIAKWITGFRLYPNSDTEHYHIMRLHEFVVD